MSNLPARRRWSAQPHKQSSPLSAFLQDDAARCVQRIFPRARKCYQGVTPSMLSRARQHGGALAGLVQLMLAADPEGLERLVEFVESTASIIREQHGVSTPRALVLEATESNAQDEVASAAFLAFGSCAIDRAIEAKEQDLARDRMALIALRRARMEAI